MSGRTHRTYAYWYEKGKADRQSGRNARIHGPGRGGGLAARAYRRGRRAGLADLQARLGGGGRLNRLLCYLCLHDITTATNPRLCVRCGWVQPKPGRR